MNENDNGGDIPSGLCWIKNNGPNGEHVWTEPEWLERLADIREWLRGANLLPEEPPSDPKERALWLKQHRNTGPEKPKDWRKR